MHAVLALALIAPAQADGGETWIGVSAGALNTQFRDQHLTPLRHGGWGPVFGLHVETVRPDRLDRVSLSYHFGASDGWRWHSGEVDSMWAPRVVGSGDDGLYVGVKHDSSFALRLWSNGTWQSNVTFGAVVGGRFGLLERGEHRLWLEGTLSTPLVGVVGRPGFAAPFQNNSMSLRDWMFASLHNHVAMDGTVSMLWLRPSGSHLRLELRSLDQRIAVRHPVTRARLSAALVAYWRL